MKSLIAMAALVAVSIAPAAYAAAAPASASPASTTPSGQPAKKAPVDISSDHAESHSATCTAVWSGAAEALQDTSRLRADVMVTHQEIKKDKPAPSAGAASSSACGDTISLEAKGNVYYASSDGRRVHGDNAIYDYASTTITITGDVTAVDGQNVMRGTKMVYNTQTGEGHMEGSAKGAGAKTRPRGVFYPKDTNDNPGDAAQNGKASEAKPKKKAAQ
jgi:lipopolysaccharide export system protein LptA